MDVRGLLTEGFGRITELYDGVAEGVEERTLHERPGGTGNHWVLDLPAGLALALVGLAVAGWVERRAVPG